MTNAKTRATLAVGDAVAVRAGNSLRRAVVSRCTKTQIEVDGKRYKRGEGSPVGGSRSTRFGSAEWIEVWNEEKHMPEIIRKRAQSKLDKARYFLREFRWTSVTQEQADAVVETMVRVGMVEPEKAEHA